MQNAKGVVPVCPTKRGVSGRRILGRSLLVLPKMFQRPAYTFKVNASLVSRDLNLLPFLEIYVGVQRKIPLLLQHELSSLRTPISRSSSFSQRLLCIMYLSVSYSKEK
jgi:hypothetical protein